MVHGAPSEGRERGRVAQNGPCSWSVAGRRSWRCWTTVHSFTLVWLPRTSFLLDGWKKIALLELLREYDGTSVWSKQSFQIRSLFLLTVIKFNIADIKSHCGNNNREPVLAYLLSIHLAIILPCPRFLQMVISQDVSPTKPRMLMVCSLYPPPCKLHSPYNSRWPVKFLFMKYPNLSLTLSLESNIFVIALCSNTSNSYSSQK